jgi:hypothetical protein
MKAASETEQPSPPEAAFVLQLRTDADPASGTLAGRVEHVVSGRATRFGSIGELLAFVGRELRRHLNPRKDT